MSINQNKIPQIYNNSPSSWREIQNYKFEQSADSSEFESSAAVTSEMMKWIHTEALHTDWGSSPKVTTSNKPHFGRSLGWQNQQHHRNYFSAVELLNKSIGFTASDSDICFRAETISWLIGSWNAKYSLVPATPTWRSAAFLWFRCVFIQVQKKKQTRV